MTPPAKAEKRRQEIVERVAAHLVQEGFQNSGLRALASSVGISDRMVMYYFDTKEELIAEALDLIGSGLAESMDATLADTSGSVGQILETLVAAGKTEQVRAVMRLWFEIIGLAMRGQQPYQQTAAQLLQKSEARIRNRLRSDQKHRAREVLARLEGELLVSLLMD